jgi:hypothetical protein
VPVDTAIKALNKSVLVPHGWPKFGGEFNLLNKSAPNLPVEPGVYALLITHDGPLLYPRSTSSVIYIGCAFGPKGLRGRLNRYRQRLRQCRAEAQSGKPEQKLFAPRYEWITAKGGICLFSVAPDGGTTSRHMEALLLERFVYLHYTLPVANGQHGVQYQGGADIGRDSDQTISPIRPPSP